MDDAQHDAPSTDPVHVGAEVTAEASMVAPETIDALAGQLVWRIGRLSDEAPITVRVGLPSAAGAFADLPRLRTATEAELKEAIDTGNVKVEWIAAKGRA